MSLKCTTSLPKLAILLGDSITQQGFMQNGWAGLLSNEYQRRIDVVNRGFSGYNSKVGGMFHGYIISFIPSSDQQNYPYQYEIPRYHPTYKPS